MISILMFLYTIHLVNLQVYTTFDEAGSNGGWEICDRFLSEKDKNGQTKGLISNMWLIILYTVQLTITKLCTKYKDP